MKQIVFFLFLFSLVNFTHAQQNINQAQKHIYLAQYFVKKNEKEKAFKEYQRAFELSPFKVKKNIVPFTKLCFELSNITAIENSINKSSHFVLFGEFFFKEGNLKDYANKFPFKEILASKMNILQNNYYSNVEYISKIEFEKEIEKLDFADQYIRQIIEEKEDRKCLWDLMTKEDSIIISQLIDLTKQYGWNEKAATILWHQRGTYGKSDFVWNYFVPFINGLIKKDEVKKDFFLKFELNEAMIHRKAYVYDYWPPLAKVYTQADVDKIDSYRKSVGLPPLYFNKFIDTEYNLPPGYKYNAKNLLNDLLSL